MAAAGAQVRRRCSTHRVTFGPCGPAWTECPGRPRRPRDAADRRIPDGAPERMVPRARGLREGDGGPPRTGAAVLLAPDPHQRRPSGPEHAACRSLLRSGVNRRADSSRPRNTWPHDRYDSRRRSSLRSAVIARDSPVRWPAVPGLASLPPLPAPRLPFRVHQHHKTIATPLRNGPDTGPPARRPGRCARVNGCSSAAPIQVRIGARRVPRRASGPG